MNLPVKFIIVSVTIMSVLVSCDFIRDIFPSNKSELTFKASLSSGINEVDTVLFSGSSIKWLNGTTGEVRFADSLTIPNIFSFHRIKCYLGNDSLFAATMTSDFMSSIVNDLVLNHNLKDGKYYFADGYPPNLSNIETNTVRFLNYQKRANAWKRFIGQLKKEGRFVEK